jgi:hypothetical protein
MISFLQLTGYKLCYSSPQQIDHSACFLGEYRPSARASSAILSSDSVDPCSFANLTTRAIASSSVATGCMLLTNGVFSSNTSATQNLFFNFIPLFRGVRYRRRGRIRRRQCYQLACRVHPVANLCCNGNKSTDRIGKGRSNNRWSVHYLDQYP